MFATVDQHEGFWFVPLFAVLFRFSTYWTTEGGLFREGFWLIVTLKGAMMKPKQDTKVEADKLVRDMVKGDLNHGFFAEKITAYWFEKSYDQMGDLTRRLGIAEEEERQVFG